MEHNKRIVKDEVACKKPQDVGQGQSNAGSSSSSSASATASATGRVHKEETIDSDDTDDSFDNIENENKVRIILLFLLFQYMVKLADFPIRSLMTLLQLF